ncbi:peptidase inhibitor family I36 protein [Kitasatospora griseola]|uniref:peptidase inhibitor family I36 protein n=1 Tax=Kitasatospora griseola TaxID=2064 RepID=UPI00365AE48B
MSQTGKQVRLSIGVAAALSAAVWFIPATSAQAATAWNCNTGSFCAYTGDNGTGSVCAWSGDDPD